MGKSPLQGPAVSKDSSKEGGRSKSEPSVAMLSLSPWPRWLSLLSNPKLKGVALRRALDDLWRFER